MNHVDHSTDTQATGAPSLVASFPDYAQAQALVDRMSDDGFPVQHVRIVGDGVHTVEQVTGRMTLGKSAAGGAATGAWFGLLIGLLFGLFAIDAVSWLVVLLTGLALGAVWGAVFGLIAHALTKGERDFSSVMSLRASRYDVYVDADYASEAGRYREQ